MWPLRSSLDPRGWSLGSLVSEGFLVGPEGLLDKSLARGSLFQVLSPENLRLQRRHRKFRSEQEKEVSTEKEVEGYLGRNECSCLA